MKQAGFTLVELLVTVVIIGVLVAIAVSAYQKATLKSRFNSVMATAKAIRDGNEVHFLMNGLYANRLSDLDVTTASNDNMTVTVSGNSEYAHVMATQRGLNNNYIMYQKHSENFPGEIHCEALADDELAEYVCRSAGATRDIGTVLTEGYTTYIIEGAGAGVAPGADDDNNESGQISCASAEALGYTCNITTNDQGQQVKKICTTIGSNNFCRTKTFNEDGGYTSVTCQANSDGVCTSNFVSATYDANGNQTSQRQCSTVDNNGNCTAYSNSNAYDYTYDANGNQLTKRRCSGVDSISGNCTAYSSPNSYGYIYDENNNLLAIKECYSYDSNGNCKQYGNAGFVYTYDENGNMLTRRACGYVSVGNAGVGCSSPRGGGADYTYDTNGNMVISRFCSNSQCVAYGTTYNYTYDENGNMLTQRNCKTVDSNGKCTGYDTSSISAENYDYVYDDNGKLIASRTCYGNNINTSTGECIAYDSTILQPN